GPAIALTGGSGESHRLLATDRAAIPQSDAPYFNPAGSVSAGYLSLPYSHGLATGDAIIYSSGGGTAIRGLVDGGTYYVNVSGSGIRLALTKCAAAGGSECTGPLAFIALDTSVA